ncbi:von Willebrand factor A domain-containing protein DDB_G0292740-like [Phalaenopsis equestris]|uniref:von Willebrand factor A domain-containing protein DDB_G0292740-like n=1 Tax=Phalaenopsis equestris TaxID=78828 RepID=UPI0009E46777|nr:von Willebrand factor A domain-containing protein DDB_G0292740-like [Phalaenopsis equestris]
MEEFTMSVEEGLRLAKRVCAGKGRIPTVPPRQPDEMDGSRASLVPMAPMMYAVIVDPAIVDNPDIPSYQPHVYGRCDPPALIPLQMKEIAVTIDCYLDTALITVRGRWRVHCVMGSCRCDCRLVVPLGEQGSILGAEVKFSGKSCSTQVVHREDDQNNEKKLKNEDRYFLKPCFFSLTIPQVDGGCDISLVVSWSQKSLYRDGHLSIRIPFTFPENVTPFTGIVEKEKILLNVNPGTEKDVIIQKSTHSLKEKGWHAGRFSFCYEADVDNWSTKDFEFSYSVFTSYIYGSILLNSPSMNDIDQRNMFCLYLYPGSNQKGKVFRKEVIFLVDISESMQGKPLESVKSALLSILPELAPTDYFNIIAFNDEMSPFSSSLLPVNSDLLGNTTRWISKNFVAYGGTDIMQPLNEALRMFAENSIQSQGLLFSTKNAVPYVFLITDGAVENERIICHTVKSHVENGGSMSPRICTFGIGSYCNHYFLQMLSSLSRGQYGAAYDQESIEQEMQKWLRRALFPVLTDITVDAFDDLKAFEIYPYKLPDLLIECPLIISGRYEGKFPSTVKVKGRSADMNDVTVNLKVQNSTDIPIEKVFAKQHIDLLTAQAWFFESKQLEQEVTFLPKYL